MSLHSSNRRWIWSGLLAAAGTACLLPFLVPADQRAPVAASAKDAGEVEEPGVAAAQTALAKPRHHAADPGFPPEFFRKHPPGSRIPMRIPFVGAGIEVGPGLFLPPLNGVKVEDGIPAIGRNPRLPPPGPVVAKVVAADGQEYWEHRDGSFTSCTYSQVQTPDGNTKEIVATQHGAIASQRRSTGSTEPGTDR